MFIPILALAMVSHMTGANDMNKGSFLYRSCKDLIRLWDGDRGADSTRAVDCKSYILGFLDGTGFAVAQDTKYGSGAANRWLYCLDGSPQEDVAVRVHVNWMEKHPKALSDPRSVGVVGALADAYPCPTRK